ncbi:non-ribosomal peptide synthetase [Pyxidicoccus trucidator]|uniref:non-ribosomal peptide synthetase n=1 Tax=Pyxidicoccus trucidator TaxID=2709662 RepID=UPI0013D96C6D|nr:non-ribosomal peptide synthetase [Pyxidicoccus trucidator]
MTPFHLEQPVADRFDAVARALPDRLAIDAPSGEWSYARLARESRRVASAIHAQAPSTERVGLLCGHDGPAIGAILGLLRAGKTWVPMDSRHPPSRLAAIWEDAGAGALVCDAAHRAVATRIAGDRVLCLEDLGDGEEVPSLAVRPGAVAYLLYTSGSTGRPKGVIQSHRNLLHHARAYARSLDLTPDDRVALLASLAVDAALMDVFGALLSGASLHLWDLASKGAEGLADWLDARGITLYHSTPTVFRFWMRELPAGRTLTTVRRVVLGGEPAHGDDLAGFRRAFAPTAVLVNGLGPTESTLALQAFFSTDTRPPAGLLPVGRPVEDTQVLLLDERGAEVETEGELAIRSPHVALGYWNQPELTRAAFLPDPDGGERRIYRTGDLARREPDGSLLFLGRKDLRLKLRGWGVEPEEIESRLRSLEGVGEAAVVLQERASGGASLVAFAAPRSGASLDGAALLARLREVLPAVMVPARLVVLDTLPTTASGKLDRQALIGWRDEAPRAFRPPEGPEQRWVARSFARLLDLDEASVGADSHLFELGGHSLMAARLLAQARAAFGVELPLATVFETPTVAGLAAGLVASAGAGPAGPALEPLPRGGPLPLSFAQERLLFFDRLMPGHPTYHVPAASRLRGRLDAALLRAALADVVARHEVLRATFTLEDGVPVQRVSPGAPLDFEQVSLDVPPGTEVATRAREEARERALRPFDLARGPLVRATLFRLGEDDHFLVLVAHHLAVDGWSLQQLFTEWSEAYAARREGRPVRTDGARLQYADFAAWQRRLLEGPRLDALSAWWKQRLAGLPELQLPTDRPRPPVQSRRGGWCRFELPAPLVGSLRALGREAGATFYMTCLAAFGVLLSRHTGQEDLAVASPVADRPLPELHDVLGTFVNTLALRLDLSGNPTVRQLLERVRGQAVDAFAHAGLPFERVVASAGVQRDAGREPLTQAMLIVHHGEPGHPRLDGVTAEPVELHLGVAMFDLTLTVRESERVQAWFEYATDLFDASTIERLRERWLTLLSAMAAGVDRPVGELTVLPTEERQRLLRDFNDTRSDFDLGTSVRARILAQAGARADAPAVAFGDARLSQGELLTWSRRIAHALHARGVGPGALVPVVVRRGLDLVAAWLGVLEAGAAFVPIDPGWPVERMRAALVRLAPRAVVVDSAHEFLDVLAGLPKVATAPLRGGERPPPVAPLPEPESPVYGFFTSGTTGEPKLALVAHRGLSNRFAWMDGFFGPDAPVTLQTTPHFFDSAVWQLLWPLCRGGMAVVPSDSPVLTAGEITALVERHGVTLVDFVPSVLDALLPQFAADDTLERRLRSLRHVIAGGEALRPETLHAFRAAMPAVRLTNLYGPTEATIGCIAAVLGGHETTIPIGRPIANVKAVVLDPERRLAPLGVPGELYVTGACLGLGYHGNPEATRRAFVDNPFPELEHPRLYRTGDRVRLRADGTLDFLGRCDGQLKVRGLRIEPGEVEAALRSHPGVREAFVAAGKDRQGQPELWAWLAPGPVPEDLREHLRARLPAGLVPAVILACEALPRLPGGKLDTKALPRPVDVPAATPLARPKTALEQSISEVWQRVLRLDVVDPQANFFDLGGHSLLALKAQAELQRGLGREVPLLALFRHPTVAGLAAHLSGAVTAVEAPRPQAQTRQAAIARRRRRNDEQGPRGEGKGEQEDPT